MTRKPMTRQEILDQAQVGGLVTIQLPIVEIDVDSNDLNVAVNDVGWLGIADIIAIEPPPLTIEQQLDNALAEIERLKAEKHILKPGCYTVGIPDKPQAPNPWRDHDGGDMPCDPDLMIEIQTRDGITLVGDARTWRWKHNSQFKHGDIIRWRPHKEQDQ